MSKGVLEGERPWLGSRRKCRGEALLRCCITLPEGIIRGDGNTCAGKIAYIHIYLIIYIDMNI